jgi:ABC-type transporter Mla subunit MlaD
MIDLAKAADTQEELDAAREFKESLTTMVTTSGEAVAQVRELSNMLEQAASFSRDLRPVALKIRDSLRRIADGQAVMDGWLARFGED